jgi:hypothetical protein
MTVIAYAFLQHPCVAAASGGKRNLQRSASTDAADHSQGRPHRLRQPAALSMPALSKAAWEIDGMNLPKVLVGASTM